MASEATQWQGSPGAAGGTTQQRPQGAMPAGAHRAVAALLLAGLAACAGPGTPAASADTMPTAATPTAAVPTAALPTAGAPAAALQAPAARPQHVPVHAPDDDLLRAFGGKAGLQHLADVFVDRMRADARIGHYFEKTKLPQLKAQLGDHLCQLLAGPCVYDGDSMQAAHADLKIDRADSFAQVEILQSTMDTLGIPFRRQNQLLARLAPMYRDIITR